MILFMLRSTETSEVSDESVRVERKRRFLYLFSNGLGLPCVFAVEIAMTCSTATYARTKTQLLPVPQRTTELHRTIFTTKQDVFFQNRYSNLRYIPLSISLQNFIQTIASTPRGGFTVHLLVFINWRRGSSQRET